MQLHEQHQVHREQILANIINEGALRAVKHGRKIVKQEDLEESVEVVIAGYQRKNAVMSAKINFGLLIMK